MIAGLAGLLTGPLAGRAAVYDADAPPDADGPSVWITDGPTVLGARQLDARARGQVVAARLVCTSSSSAGASSLALFVAITLDGQRLAGEVLRVPMIAEAQEDRTDPSEYRWSATVDVEHTTPRGTP